MSNAPIPRLAAASPLVGRGGIWNSERGRLFGDLALRDETCAGLYRRAVDALGEQPLTVDALATGSHCVRELVNRLPGLLGEVELEGFQNDTAAARALDEALVRAGLDLANPTAHSHRDDRGDSPGRYPRDNVPVATPAGEGPTVAARGIRSAGRDEVVVPAELLEAVHRVVETHRAGTGRSAVRRSALVLGRADGPSSDPTLRLASKALETFQGRCHPRDDVTNWLDRGPGYYIEQLEVIEHVLRGRLGRFFEVVDELRAVLDDANAQVDGAWVTPHPNDITHVQARLADFQHRRVFYLGLRNPAWLRPLDQFHAFDDPPIPELNDAGQMLWRQWPPGDYLHAMAAEAPAEVAAILTRVAHQGVASSIRQLIVSAAIAMPTQNVVTLIPKLLELVDDPQVGPLMEYDFVRLVERLATDGHTRPARRLAQRLFQPKLAAADPADSEKSTGQTAGSGSTDPSVRLRSRWTQLTAGIESDLYDEALGRAVRAFAPADILPSLVSWLGHHQVLSGTYDPDSGNDRSRGHRPSISQHPQNFHFDRIADGLIDAVRDTAATVAREKGPRVAIDILRSYPTPVPVLKRIELCVLSMIVTENADALTLAAGHLADLELADDRDFHREILELAAAALPLLSDAAYQAWETTVLHGPQLDEDQQAFLQGMYEDMPAGQALAEFGERWQLERLAAVGPDALRGQTADLYARLIDVHEEPEHPGFTSWHTTTVGYGPPHPLAVRLPDLTPRQVLDLIATEATMDADGPEDDQTQLRPSERRESLARAFGDEVGRRAAVFSAHTGDVLDLGPAYAARFFSSLRDAVKSQRAADDQERDAGTGSDADTGPVRTNPTAEPIDWVAIVAALDANRVWLKADDSPDSYDSWQWVRRDVCGLLDDAARSALTRDLPGDLLDQVLRNAAALMTLLVDDPDPTPDDEEHGGSVDAYTRALTSVRPLAVRVLLLLAAAESEMRSENAEWSTGPMTMLALNVLDAMLVPHRDPSTSIAAVIGERTGWLLDIAPDWMDQHREQLLTQDPFGDVFVTTTLFTWRPHTRIIGYLTPALLNMMSRSGAGKQLTNAVRHDQGPMALIGNQLFGLYLWGHLNLDSPLLTQFFAAATVDERAGLLKHIGWQFFHTEKLDPEPLARAGRLWDWRAAAVDAGTSDVAELAGFEWWVRSGLFGVEWWLPRLTTVAERYIYPGRLPLNEELVAAAAVDPGGVVNLLRLLMAGPAPVPRLAYGMRQAAPQVLAAALDSDDPDIAANADDLINALGRQGDITILSEVDACRQGEQGAG